MGVANGTFGELLQGSLQRENGHFQVTLPIQKFSKVAFTPGLLSDGITVTPGHKFKSRALLEKLVDYYDLGIGGHLCIESELPEGKGMASSSADLVATARAFEAALGRVVPTDILFQLLRSIEPSDGVMYPEFVTFFHRKVELGRLLGCPSRLEVVAIDEGGQIDTIEYNRRNHSYTDEECAEYAGLLQTLESAIPADDIALIGRVATRSAVLNQKRNPKRHLQTVLEIGNHTRALGVVIAHSGPCIGLIFPAGPAYQEQIECATTALRTLASDVIVAKSVQRH